MVTAALEITVTTAVVEIHERRPVDVLDQSFKGEYLDKHARQPKERIPLYHLVGALDPLTDKDVEKKIGDGLPETLGQWIAAEGLTHLKIKLAGDNLDWDVERVLAVDKVATEAHAARGTKAWFYSCDFNEKCADVKYVVDFLKRIQKGRRRVRPHSIPRKAEPLRSRRDQNTHEA
jgi:hypothetical protein